MGGYRCIYTNYLGRRQKQMSERLSILIPEDLKKRIDALKKKVHLDQSSLIRILLHQAIEEQELEFAIKEYQKGQITLGEAVLFARKDYWTFLNILHERKIPASIDEMDHLAEIKDIKNEDYKKFLD